MKSTRRDFLFMTGALGAWLTAKGLRAPEPPRDFEANAIGSHRPKREPEVFPEEYRMSGLLKHELSTPVSWSLDINYPEEIFELGAYPGQFKDLQTRLTTSRLVASYNYTMPFDADKIFRMDLPVRNVGDGVTIRGDFIIQEVCRDGNGGFELVAVGTGPLVIA